MSASNPKVDWFFNKDTKWKAEYEKLRILILNSGLTEDLKWGCPCYTANGKNIILIHGFKDYCAVLFFKGAMLKDEHGILIQQTPNVQLPRQVRFKSVKDITKLQATLKKYIKEAVEVEKSGKTIKLKTTADYGMPEELQNRLDEMPELKKAFYALTPGRQRNYIYVLSQAKQAKTREAKVEKFIPLILAGKGIDD